MPHRRFSQDLKRLTDTSLVPRTFRIPIDKPTVPLYHSSEQSSQPMVEKRQTSVEILVLGGRAVGLFDVLDLSKLSSEE